MIYLCKLVTGKIVRVEAEQSWLEQAIRTDDNVTDIEGRIVNCRYIITAEACKQNDCE